MSLFKNTASQKIRVFCFDATTGLPKTGDAANITASLSKDFAAFADLTDTSASEEDSTKAKGYYLFDISQTETNADDIAITGRSTTSNIVVVGAPARMATRPPNSGALSIDSSGRMDVIKINGTSQTARDLGASVLLSVGTGTGQVNLSSGKAPATLASTDVTGNVAADVQTIKTQSVTCAGGVTVPAATLASTTNITAGTITTVTTVTNQLTAAAIAAAVWQDATAGDFTTASSIGKSLFTSGAVPGAAGGLFIAGTNAATTITTALTTTFTGNLTGSVASVSGTVGSVTAAVTLSAGDSPVFYSSTATAGGASTLTDSGQSWTTNALAGCRVKITSGTGSHQARVIVSNTATALTVDRAWATNPSTDSVYAVVEGDQPKTDASLQVTAASVQGNVTGSVASVSAGVTVTTNNDKTGYSISGTKTTLDALNDITAAAVWAAGTRTLTASLDPTSAVIAAAVWDLATSGHTTSGTFGAAMNAAGSAGDPWGTALPGAYGAGTAGFIVGSNIDATVSSRSTYAGGDTSGTTTLLSRVPGTVQPQTGDAYARVGAAGAGLTAVGDTRLAHLDADVSSRSTYAGGDTSGTTTLLARLTSTRAGYLDNLSAGAVALAGSAPSWYTAPVDVSSNVSAIKAKTDNLPTAPADETLVIAATNAIMARLGAPAGASLAADIATRLATSGYTTPPTVAAIATGVWTDATAGDFTTTGTPGKILVGQLGGAFTTTTSSIYSTAALANAPSGGGGSGTVTGYATGQDPATLVLDALSASHNTAGTIGQKINAAGGAADPLTNEVPGTYASGTAGAALGRIGSGQITTTSIVGQSGNIGPLIQGDSYYAAEGRAIDWTDRSTGWPDLTGATITVTFLPRSGSVTKTGSVVTAGGSAQKVRLELTATDTAALPLGGFPFHVTATLSSTRVATLVRGNAVVAQT